MDLHGAGLIVEPFLPQCTSHIAPGIIAAGVDHAYLVGAGGPRGVEARHLVRVAAVAIEVLVLGGASIKRSLPELAQVRGDVRGAVAAP